MHQITPVPGFILVEKYYPTDETFSAVKDTPGELRRSTVRAIGPDLVDDQEILRKAHCKIGDIIYHAPAADDFLLDSTQMHLVHFSNVRGVYTP